MASVQSAPNVSAQGGGVGLGPGRLPKVTREQVQQAYLVPTSPPPASFVFDM